MVLNQDVVWNEMFSIRTYMLDSYDARQRAKMAENNPIYMAQEVLKTWHDEALLDLDLIDFYLGSKYCGY